MSRNYRFSDPVQIIAMPPARLFRSYAERMAQENMDASLIAATEFNWRRAAEESHRRVIANHYSPRMPPGINARVRGKPMLKR